MKPVTLADVEATILSQHYFTAGEAVGAFRSETYPEGRMKAEALDLLTFCVLVTRSGHTVTGESYCQDPAKFDVETGREWARKAAIDKLFPMVVFERRQLEQFRLQMVASTTDPVEQAAAAGVGSGA